MALIDELKEKREVWRINVSLHDQRALDEVSFALAAQAMVDDLDTAIAALEPASAEPEAERRLYNPGPPTLFGEAAPYSIDWGNEPAPAEQAPVQPDPLSAELRSDPGSEENAGTNSEDEEDASSDDEDDWDDEDDAPTEIISDLTGDPAIEAESGLHGQPWTPPTEDEMRRIGEAEDAVDATLADDPEPTELDAPASIVDDPELLAAVARAEATLQEAEPAYVGLQDAELDAEFDAMKERRDADKPKPLTDTWHNKFGIFGKREDA